MCTKLLRKKVEEVTMRLIFQKARRARRHFFDTPRNRIRALCVALLTLRAALQ